MRHSELVVVQAFGTEAEADVAKGVLESAGIDAMIQADTAGRMRPHLAWSALGFRVLVREEDAATARDVLGASNDSQLVVVQSFGTQAEAAIASEALLSAGIFAMMEGDLDVGVRLSLAWDSKYRVLVREEDVAKAREVLQPPHDASA
jgi:hypothetical protein